MNLHEEKSLCPNPGTPPAPGRPHHRAEPPGAHVWSPLEPVREHWWLQTREEGTETTRQVSLMSRACLRHRTPAMPLEPVGNGDRSPNSWARLPPKKPKGRFHCNFDKPTFISSHLLENES